MKRLIVLSCLLFVTTICGCAHKFYWTLPAGSTQQDFRRDSYQCQYDAIAITKFTDDYLGIETRRWYIQCMESRGYTLDRVTYRP